MTGSSFFSSRLGGSLIGATVGAGAAYAWVNYTASGKKFLERFDDPNKVFLVAALLGGVAAYLLNPCSSDSGVVLAETPKQVDATPEVLGMSHADHGEGEGGGEAHQSPPSPRPVPGPYEDQVLDEPFLP